MKEDKLSTKESEPKHQKKEASIFSSVQRLEEEVLLCVSRQSRYGLEIIQVFEDVSNGEKTINIGTLYTILSRLERKSLVTSSMEDRPKDSKGGARRKYFTITDKGTLFLHQNEDFRRTVTVYQLQSI